MCNAAASVKVLRHAQMRPVMWVGLRCRHGLLTPWMCDDNVLQMCAGSMPNHTISTWCSNVQAGQLLLHQSASVGLQAWPCPALGPSPRGSRGMVVLTGATQLGASRALSMSKPSHHWLSSKSLKDGTSPPPTLHTGLARVLASGRLRHPGVRALTNGPKLTKHFVRESISHWQSANEGSTAKLLGKGGKHHHWQQP